MKLTVIYSLFCIFVNGLLCNMFENIHKLNLTRYCPSTNFCTQKARNNFSNSEMQPCCASCLCTVDCHVYGNCCPDAEQQVAGNTLVPECYFPVYNIDPETQDQYNSNIFTGIHSYNTFVKCPETYRNQTVKNLCEGVPKEIEDFRLVSNKKGYIYRNKYCAMCNGVVNFLSWSLKVKCQSTEDAIIFHKILPNVKNRTCMIWSFPQKVDILQNSICYKARDTCKIRQTPTPTALSFLQNVCNSYTLYYFDNVMGKIVIFKNIHCFACTRDFNLFFRETCLPMTSDHAIKTDSYTFPMTAIIDMGIHKNKDKLSEISEINKCEKSDIYDFFFKRCRALDCPVISTAFFGKCISYVSNNVGFSVSMQLELKPIGNQAEFRAFKAVIDRSDAYIYDSFYENLLISFVNSTNELMRQCGRCETNFAEDGLNFFVLTAFHTNAKCTTDSLLFNSYMYSKEKHRFGVFINNRTFEFIVNAQFGLSPEMMVRLIRRYRLKSSFCDRPYQLNGNLVCPKISLNETEYQMLQTETRYNGTVQEREIANIRNKEDSNVYSKTTSARKVEKNTRVYDLCWDEYLKLINTGNSINIFVWIRVINVMLNGLLLLLGPLY